MITNLFRALLPVFFCLGLSGHFSLQGQARALANPSSELLNLHLNKTFFFRGEELWFSAYSPSLSDQENSEIPVLIALYNQEGEEKSRRIIGLRQGKGFGQIPIDTTLKDSLYFVRAALISPTQLLNSGNASVAESTPVLKAAFEQAIGILKDEPLPLRPDTREEPLALEVVPEGGELPAGIPANVGFRVLNFFPWEYEGFKAELLGDSGEILLRNITVNHKGHGILQFAFELGKQYTLQLTTARGETLQVPVPRATSQGIGLRVNAINEEFIFVNIQANPEFRAAHNTIIWALDGADESDLQSLDLEADQTLRIERRKVPEGILTLRLYTLEGEELAKRLVYNEYPATDRGINATLTRSQVGDSLELRMSWDHNDSEKNLPLVRSRMSLSVLPGESQAYRPNGVMTTRRSESMRGERFIRDLALLLEEEVPSEPVAVTGTSGNLVSEEVFPVISGRVGDADLSVENQVVAVSDFGKDMTVLDLNSDKTFEFRSAHFYQDTLRISLMGRNGRLNKGDVILDWEFPKIWEATIAPALQEPELPEWPYRDEFRKGGSDRRMIQEDLSAIALEEVEVTAEAESSDIPLMNVNMNGKRINAEELRRSTSLASFLRRQGFVITYGGQGRLVVLSRRLNPESASGGGPPRRTPVPIVVNGMVREGLDLNIPLSKVQTVFYTDYAVSVQLHRDNFFIANRERYSNFEVPAGYVKPDRFAIPLNFNTQSPRFLSFGQVFWEPDIILPAEEEVVIRFPDPGLTNFRVFIEGVSDTGEAFAEEVSVSLPKP
ncbi:hypothetical protein SAMN04490243_2816 [Robiginitalea myxolifaciens]|uniref:MG2 domain-containing protein n=1 Tax=Robiginitalea myxolifaciens TaxID=400055 RepID=A0A1I6HJM1_9FLAO|nr:hypothetical protein [Robiginitalea myxolifaciens]SFR54574.1 hypothetical protein SAMN04490243_2816 [Robiginitalea myxolifaciens]